MIIKLDMEKSFDRLDMEIRYISFSSLHYKSVFQIIFSTWVLESNSTWALHLLQIVQDNEMNPYTRIICDCRFLLMKLQKFCILHATHLLGRERDSGCTSGHGSSTLLLCPPLLVRDSFVMDLGPGH